MDKRDQSNKLPVHDEFAMDQRCRRCIFEFHCSWVTWKGIGVPVLMGQFLACLIAITAICSTFLAKADANLPLTQNLLHYGLLSLFYISWKLVSIVVHRHNTTDSSSSTSSTLRPTPLYNKSCFFLIGLYVLTGVIDTFSNWCFVAAYRYTSVTSIQLLDCVTIPTSMLASYLILYYRFSWTHYIAVLISLLGAGCMVAADVLANTQLLGNTTSDNFLIDNFTQPRNSVILGDLLVVLGAVGYGISNVFQQYLVTHYGIVSFLAFAGLAAFVPTLIFGLITEWKDILRVFSTPTNRPVVYGCLSGYVASMFALYTAMPHVLAMTNAILVNLSLLTCDVYALLIGIYVFHYRFHVLYVLCFVVILCGVGLFSIRKPVIQRHRCRCLPCTKKKYPIVNWESKLTIGSSPAS